MKRFRNTALLIAGLCLGCAGTTEYVVSRPDAPPPSLIEFFREQDICQRATLLSVSQLPTLHRDGRWTITVVLASGRDRGRRLIINSLTRPSDYHPSGPTDVVVYAKRNWSDRGRYWGNVLRIIPSPGRSDTVELEDRPWRTYRLTLDEFFRLVGQRP